MVKRIRGGHTGALIIASSLLAGIPATAQDYSIRDLGTTVAITNFETGECLDVANGSIFKQGRVKTYPCHGGANQQWLVRYHPACLDRGNNRLKCWDFIFINLKSGLCLDVPGGNPAKGLQQYTCHYGKNQRFKVTWRPMTVGGASIRSYTQVSSYGQPTHKVISPGANQYVRLSTTSSNNDLNYWSGIPR